MVTALLARGARSAVAAAGRAAHELARRPFHAGLAAAVGGLALSEASSELTMLAAAATVAGLLGLGAQSLGTVCAGLVLGGAAIGALRLDAIDRSATTLRPGERVAARAHLLEAPREGRFGASAAVEIRTGPGRGQRVLARGGLDERWPLGGGPGTEVRLGGMLETPRTRPGAAFDWPAYLRRRGIAAELDLDTLEATGARRGGPIGAVDLMRTRAERALATGLPPPRAALMRGMVLGQDEAIAPEVREDFRRSGLAHLLAVSGQNVMLLGALAIPFLSAAGLGVRGRIVGVLVLIAVYVPLAGAGASLQRAGVMGAAGLVAIAVGRPASRWYALLLAAAVTLGANPRVLEDPGWQLSFVAVAGIAWWSPALRRALGGLPAPLAEGLAVTVAASAATAPLLAHHFGAVSLAGLPANVLALPVVAPIMWLGMIEAALGQLTALGGTVEAVVGVVCGVLGEVGEMLLAYLEGLAVWFAEAPGAEVALPLASSPRVVLAYGLLGLATVASARAARKVGPLATSWAAAWRRVPFARRITAGACAAALVVALGWAALGPNGPPDRLTVSFVDVGQGDATLIQHPAGGAVLFDGGPPEGRVVRRLRQAGVTRLSAVVATHASRDHHGGLADVLRQIPTEVLLDGGDGTGDPAFRAVLAEAARRGVRRVPARAGQDLRVGGLSVRVLAPVPRPPGPAPEDPNPRAVVAVVSAGPFDLFLSGDAESPSLVHLPLPDVEAMKVPHHGSADPGLPGVLARLRPQVAAIEVGQGNGYGHPTAGTLSALRRAGARVHRTDEDGTVSLSVSGTGMEVHTER